MKSNCSSPSGIDDKEVSPPFSLSDIDDEYFSPPPVNKEEEKVANALEVETVERFRGRIISELNLEEMDKDKLVELLVLLIWRYEQEIQEIKATHSLYKELSEHAMTEVVNQKAKTAELIPKAVSAGAKAGKREVARAGAAKRHEPNQDAKALIFKLLDESPPAPRGKDKKALELVELRAVEQTFRTIRKWINEWEKQKQVD